MENAKKNQELLKECGTLLATWFQTIANHNTVDFYDDNRSAEDITAGLLNLLYGYRLSNLNRERPNFPAVDIGDDHAGIAFQVTTQVTSEKIKTSVHRFVEHQLSNRFSQGIRFFLLSPEKSRVRALKDGARIQEGDIVFDPADHIFGQEDVLLRLKAISQDEPRHFPTLAAQLKALILHWVQMETAVGPQKISLSRLPVTDPVIYGREDELDLLDAAWADATRTMVTLIAWGGVGKSALVNRWLRRMAERRYAGARRVYGWSFYSQGSREGTQVSADDFIHDTLTWFGDPDPSAGSPHDKGKRLARLVCESPALVILDGLEPMQYPHSGDHGHGMGGGVKDPALKVFLKELAAGMRGLCVVSSREPLTDLRSHWGHEAAVLDLAHLTPEAGARLLKEAGLKGREADFRAAAQEYGGHALALRLLASYLKRSHQADVRCRDRIITLMDEEEKGKHARRVMATYKSIFTKYPKFKLLRGIKRFQRATPQLSILYMLALFDRPAPPGALAVLRAEPAIRGLTEGLLGLAEEEWNAALSDLREAGLLARPDTGVTGDGETLDCHPLVREFFGEQLRQTHPKAWQGAHKRLYAYYKELPEEPQPDTLAEMEPLFAAVAHGCRAGLEQEALDEVYYPRIQRDGKTNFCCKKLGAFGADLAVLSHFFQGPWRLPAPGLRAEAKALVLSWSAFGLRALGRLREAVEPMKACLELNEKQEDWINAAINASNLSQLLLTLGDVSEAVAVARRGAGHADRSGDKFQMESKRTTLADALHQWGRLGEAARLFREADGLQRERQREYPYLYSLRGYQYCDLLLSGTGDGKGPAVQEVRERAEKTLEWVSQAGVDLLSIALDHLTLGRCRLLEAEPAHTPPGADATQPLKEARLHLDRAVAGLREAGVQDYLIRGLLARAHCRRLQGETREAAEDLKECREIATMGEMKLHLADVYLEKFRLEGDRKDLEKAHELIKKTQYRRREDEVKGLMNNA